MHTNERSLAVSEDRDCMRSELARLSGDVESLRQAYLRDADVIRLTDDEEWTVAHLAVIGSAYEVAEQLLEWDCSVFLLETAAGYTPFALACAQGDMHMMHVIMNGLRDRVVKHMDKAFAAAVAYDRVDAAKLMVQWGANPLALFSSEGRSMYYHAMFHDSMNTVQWLLEAYPEFDPASTDPVVEWLNAATSNDIAALNRLYTSNKLFLRMIDDHHYIAAHQAAKFGAVRSLKCLLEWDPSLSTMQTHQGDTLWSLAAGNNKIKVLNYLLSERPNDISSSLIQQSILRAIESNSLDCLELLLTMDNEIFCTDSMTGDNAAHVATRYDREVALRKLLMSHPSLLNGKNNNHQTPLHTAAMFSAIKCLELLASRDDIAIERDSYGRVPHHWAAERGPIEGLKILHEAMPQGTAEADSVDGNTCWHYACHSYQLDLLHFILSLPIDPRYIFNTEGFTPFHEAVLMFPPALEPMYAAYPDVLYIRSISKLTPLELATRNGKLESVAVLERLLKYSNIANQPNCHDLYAWFDAARNGNIALVRKFYRRRKEIVCAVDHAGWNAAHLAARHGRLSTIMQLLCWKITLGACRTPYEHTPLSLACRGGHAEVIGFLQATVEPSEYSKMVDLAVETAVASDMVEAVEELTKSSLDEPKLCYFAMAYDAPKTVKWLDKRYSGLRASTSPRPAVAAELWYGLRVSQTLVEAADYHAAAQPARKLSSIEQTDAERTVTEQAALDGAVTDDPTTGEAVEL